MKRVLKERVTSVMLASLRNPDPFPWIPASARAVGRRAQGPGALLTLDRPEGTRR